MRVAHYVSLAMLLLAALALAAIAHGQTPPPATGDWVIHDWTSIDNASIAVHGDVVVGAYGRLALRDVELVCRNLTVDQGVLRADRTRVVLEGGASLSMKVRPYSWMWFNGGSLSSTTGDAKVFLESYFCLINGTTVTNFQTVHIASWGCAVTNCTIVSLSGNGVTVSPGWGPFGLIDISNNIIERPGQAGVSVFVASDPGHHWQINIVGNVVTDAGGDGIYLATGQMEGARVVVRDNRVEGARGTGIHVAVRAGQLALLADGNRVEGASQDGVRISIDSPLPSPLVVSDIVSTGNGALGIALFSVYAPLDGLEVHRCDASGNGAGGIYLGGLVNATVWDSTLSNPGSTMGDLVADHSTVVVHRTAHRKALAQVYGDWACATSVRELRLRFVWSDGSPCALRAVEMRDERGALVIAATTDADGQLGDWTVWDWLALPGGTQVRFSLRAFLVDGDPELEGGSVALDRDVEATLAFADDVAPVLAVTAPAEGEALPVGSVVFEGTCADAHSGVAWVEVGLSAGGDVPPSSWERLQVSGAWSASFEGLAEGAWTVWVRAADHGTGLAGTSRNLTVDTTVPVINVISPPDGCVTNARHVLVQGATEEGATVTVALGAALMQGGAFESEVALDDGPNDVVIEARDRAGHVGTLVLRVLVDRTPPAIWVNRLVDGLISAPQGHYEVLGWVERGARLRVERDGTSLPVPVDKDGAFGVPLRLGPEGVDLVLVATDIAGNSAATPVHIEPLREGTGLGDGEPLTYPALAVVVVAGGALASVGAVASTEVGRYSLLVAFVPLYARVRKDEVLDNSVRYLIHGHVIDNPGIHYKALLRELDLSNGLVTYHLEVLEREGFIHSVRDGTLRRFYAANVRVPSDRRLTPEQVEAAIKDMVYKHPGISQKQLIEELGLARRVVGYHLHELVSAGALVATQRGRNTVYTLAPRRGPYAAAPPSAEAREGADGSLSGDRT
jgi:predicted transcriptional regulator